MPIGQSCAAKGGKCAGLRLEALASLNPASEYIFFVISRYQMEIYRWRFSFGMPRWMLLRRRFAS